MEFALSHFDGYLHFIAAANFVYAEHKPFRTAFDAQIEKIPTFNSTSVTEKLNELTLKVLVFKAEPKSDRTTFNEKIERITTKFTDRHAKLTTGLKESNALAEELSRSMFLFTALYCVALLLVSGFQQFFISPTTINCTFFILNIAAIYNVVLFVWSCGISSKANVISFFIPISIVAAALLFSYFHSFVHEVDDTDLHDIVSNKQNSIIILMISLSPYLFHILKIYFRTPFFWLKFKLISFDTMFNLNKEEQIMTYAYDGSPNASIKLWNSFKVPYMLNSTWKKIKNDLKN